MRALTDLANLIDPWQQPGPIRVPLRLRPPLFHPDLPFIVFWSEKAGCTTVVKWFLAQAGVLDEALAQDPWVHNYRVRHYSRSRRYLDKVVEALASGDYTAVKVIRDPLRRAVSSFLVLSEPGAVALDPHWVQDYLHDVRHWLVRKGRDPEAGINLLEHLDIVEEATRAGRFVDSHILPQHTRGEETLLGEVIPIERFSAWCETQAAAGRVKPVDMAAIGDSGHHHIIDPARTADLGDRPEEARITPALYADGHYPAASAFINARSYPRLANVYAADLAAYGTHYPLPEGLAPGAGHSTR